MNDQTTATIPSCNRFYYISIVWKLGAIWCEVVNRTLHLIEDKY